jgi:membrane protein implicated in regulation of membrane protease activity
MANYKFEWNDIRCVTTVLNVILIMIYGLSISWFGLALAVLGIVKDLTDPSFRWNGLVMHVSSAVLNIFFLTKLF